MQGGKWQPGQRKHQWDALSTIEPAAARGHSRQPSRDSTASGHTPRLPAAGLNLGAALHKHTAAKPAKAAPLAGDPGDCEMQPLVGGHHSDSVAAAADEPEGFDSQGQDAAVAGAPMQLHSTDPDDLPDDRQVMAHCMPLVCKPYCLTLRFPAWRMWHRR